MQHTFFVNFFAVVLHYYNAKLPESFSWRKCRTCSRSLLFFTAAHFLPALLAASIVTPAFHVMSFFVFLLSLFFISRSRSLSSFFSLSFAGLPLFLCLSLALYSKFVDKTINLKNTLENTNVETISTFRFRLYCLYSCLCFKRRGWLCNFPPK